MKLTLAIVYRRLRSEIGSENKINISEPDEVNEKIVRYSNLYFLAFGIENKLEKKVILICDLKGGS